MARSCSVSVTLVCPKVRNLGCVMLAGSVIALICLIECRRLKGCGLLLRTVDSLKGDIMVPLFRLLVWVVGGAYH